MLGAYLRYLHPKGYEDGTLSDLNYCVARIYRSWREALGECVSAKRKKERKQTWTHVSSSEWAMRPTWPFPFHTLWTIIDLKWPGKTQKREQKDKSKGFAFLGGICVFFEAL